MEKSIEVVERITMQLLDSCQMWIRQIRDNAIYLSEMSTTDDQIEHWDLVEVRANNAIVELESLRKAMEAEP